MRRLMAWLVAATLVGALAGPARAQMDSREAIQLQNQILELRRDLESLRAQSGGAPVQPAPVPSAPSEGGGGGGDVSAALLERVSRLEDAVRELRGRIDEVDNARQRQFEELNKQIGDLSFKLGNGSAAGGGEGSARVPVPPLPPTGSSGGPTGAAQPGQQSAPPPRTPEIALREGNAALARRDYTAAEAIAREVIASRSPRAAEGQYLLAQSFAARRNYPQAAVAYDDAYQRNPRGGRAAESLIGLANSLTAIGEKSSACAALNKLRAEFAGRADLRPAASAARLRAGCG